MNAEEYADLVDYKRNEKLTKEIVIDIFNAGAESIKDEIREVRRQLEECKSDLCEEKFINNHLRGELLAVANVLYRKKEKLTFPKKHYNVKWHKYPEELPDDFQTVLTVAENPVTEDKIYHTFTFSEKSTFEDFSERGYEPSMVFINWCADRNYEVTAWCEIPEYEGK